MDERPDWTLLTRYVSGDCPPEDRARVDAWVAADPTARRAEIDKLRTIGHLWADAMPPAADESSAWARMRDRIEANQESSLRGGALRLSPRRGITFQPTPRSNVLKLAAAVVLAAATTFGVTEWLQRGTQQFRELASGRASRTTITLRDGSRLLLGPDTRVRVPKNFGAGVRSVELTGEAEFEVVHDPRHPFVVHTSRAVVKDIGTTFVVRSYADDATDRVAVQKGEIALDCQRGCPTAHLVAGDAATVGEHTVNLARGGDLAPLTAWVQGGLAFQDTPLRFVIRDVSREYGVDITLADTAMGAMLVTANLAHQPLDVVMEVITRAVDGTYARTHSGIVIGRATSVAPARRTVPAVLTTATTPGQ